MADDIRIEITGDQTSAKKTIKAFERLVKRFEKANRQASSRRKSTEEKTNQSILASRQRNIQRLMRLERKQTALKKREEDKRRRDAIREEKRQARERERILKRQAQRRARILRGASRFGGRALGLLGFAGAATIAYQAREILSYDKTLARLSAQAGVTTKRQLALRDSINAVSLETGVSRNVITSGIEEIIDKSGDFDLAEANLLKFSKAIQGTGVDTLSLGKLLASVRNVFKGSNQNMLPTEYMDFVEILAAQGDIAQVNLKNLAEYGEEIFGAFKGAGLTAKKDFITFGALLQTAGEAGTPAQASTAARRFLDELFAKSGKLKSNFGVNVFKPGTEELRDLDVVINELFQKTGGSITKLQSIFTERAIKPLKILAAEYRNNGGELKIFNRIIDQGSDAAVNLEKKYRRVAATSSQAFEKLAAAFTILSDKALTGVLNDMADSIQGLIDDPKKLKQLEQTAKELGNMLSLALKFGAGAVKIAELLPKLGEGIGTIVSAPFVDGESVVAKRARLQSKEMLERRISSGAKLPESVIAGLSPAERQRYFENVQLNVYTNVNLDKAGNIRSQNTAADLIDPNRGKTTVTAGSK